MNGGYDDGYKACSCFWGTQPGSLLPLLLSRVGDITGKRILDAGCGEGKNAAFLAGRGASVRAFDVSEIALKNGAATWPNLNIEWEVADVRSADLPPNSFDIVVAYGLFHCLKSIDEVRNSIERLATATKVRGYAVICAFNDRRQELEAHPGFSPLLISHADYLALFERRWNIIHATDEDLRETHPHNQIPHSHSLTRILAMKES